MDLKKIKNILKKHNIWLSKSKGQCLLVDENYIKKIVKYADLSNSEKVLEIGGGIGTLTEAIAKSAKKVITIENDPKMIRILKERLGKNKKIKIIEGDVLNLTLPKFDKIVSNLPYSISSPITTKILKKDFKFGILTYQKEFAKRMTAKPKTNEYSRLSVLVSYYSSPKILENIPAHAFFPQPEVKSSIVKLIPKKPKYKVSDENLFFKVVKGAFRHRRKKVKNSLLNSSKMIFENFDISKKNQKEIIKSNIEKKLLEKRAAKIKPKEFAKITNNLKRILNNKKSNV